jgi:uncharacterized protein (TIGR00290 family)
VYNGDMTKIRVALSWSSGKDAAWALHILRQTEGVEVVGLLTTLNQEFDRVAMHAVRRTLLERQAAAVGLPLWTVPLPWPCTNEDYERLMAAACAELQDHHAVTEIAFGDLFLEEVRAYREQKLAGTGLTPRFPLWGLPTAPLARTMLAAGVQARVTCIDPRRLPSSFAGAAFDAAFLDALPADTDPCGENGEFHTFSWDGPAFAYPLPFTVGEIVSRDGFTFADLLPEG